MFLSSSIVFWPYEFHLSQGQVFAFSKDLTVKFLPLKLLLIRGTISSYMFAMTGFALVAQVDKHLLDRD